MKSLLAIVALIISIQSHAAVGVCDRATKTALENEVKKPCDQISDDDLAKITGLTYVTLDKSVLAKEDLVGLTHLTLLHFWRNFSLKIDANAFEATPNLQDLSFVVGDIGEISDGLLNPLKELTYITFNFCGLRSLDARTFKSNPKLTGINLNDNELHNVDERTFDGLKDLSYIGLAGNLLTTMPLTAQIIPYTFRLDGASNCVSKAEVDRIGQIKYIYHFTSQYTGERKCEGIQ